MIYALIVLAALSVVPETQATGYSNVCTGPLVYYNTYKKWQSALDYCRANGGEFPSIHNQAREYQVRGAVPGNYEFWVGYRTHQVTNTTWSDGSPFDYYNWGIAHPQAYECGSFNPYDNQWWWDRPCDDKLRFVCCYPNNNTPYPTKAPTPYPTAKRTPYPTKEPTPYPTAKRTPYPTKEPTPYPTAKRTPYPTKEPTPYPTVKRTPYPTKEPTPYPQPLNPYCPYDCYYRFKYPKVPNLPLPNPGQGDKIINYGNKITYHNGQVASGCNGEVTQYLDNYVWKTIYYDNDGHSRNVSNVFYASGNGDLKARNIQNWMSPSLKNTLKDKLIRTQITCHDPYASLLSAELMTPGYSGCLLYTVHGYHPCQDYHSY